MVPHLSSLTIILVIFTALCFNLYGQAEQEHWNPLKKENSPYSNFDITPDDTVALDVQIEVGTYQMFNEFIGSCLGATSYSDDVSLPNFIDFQTIEVTVNNFGSARAKFELSASVTAPVGGPYAGTITYTIYRNATVCRVRTFDLTITTTPALPPIADFSGIPQSGVAPFTVQFTDQTQHGVATRLWNFGDGSTSTLRNPQHTYTIPDSYNVSLEVSGPAGTDLVSKQNYIKAYDCGNGNIYWTGAGDGVSWSDPANWCSGSIPGTNDHVYIIFDEFVTAGGTYSINLDSDAAVSSLTLGGDTGQQTLAIVGATLTITNALMVKANGELELSGGAINGTGDIFVKGTLKWIGGTIGGFGNFTVDGLLSIETGGTAILVDRSLTINHTGWISHSVGTFISETDIIVNGLFSWLSGSTLSGTGFLIINDSLRIEGGGGKTLDAKTLINRGSAVWTGGSIYINNGSVFTNDTSGIFDIQTSSLNYRIQSADSGSFDNWGMLIERSATDIWVPFSNSGTVVVDSSSRLNLARDGSYSGTFVVNEGGDLTFGGSSITTHNFFPSAVITANGTVTFGIGIFVNNSDLEIEGLLRWTGGTISGTGFLVINDSLKIEGSGWKTLDDKTLINRGSAVWTGGSIYINNGSVFTNDTNGIFDIQTSSLNYRIQSADSGSFDNWGMLLERSATDIWVPFSNSGTVVVDSSSRLNLARDGSYSGTFIVNEGGDLTFGGSSITTHNFFPSAVITANGTVTFSSGMFINNSDLEIDGLLEWWGGTLSGSGVLTINDSLRISGSGNKTLDGKALINKGTAVWNGGYIYIDNGSVFTNQAGATFDIQTSSYIQSADSGSFDNQGALIKRGGWYTTEIRVPFSNSGTVQVDSSNLRLTHDFINQPGGDIRGYGTLNLSSANFINQGSVSPGTSPGILTFTGNYETSNAILNIELDNSAIPGSGHDQLLVSGSSTLGGILNLDVTNGYIPNPGDQFTILHSDNGHSGTFASINAPLWLTYQIQYTNNDVIINILTVNAPQLISPLNGAVNVTTTPGLMWHSIASADSYHVQVSTELTFLTLVVDETGIIDTLFTAPMLDNNTTYYWRVRAQNSIGPTPPWSEAWHFSTIGFLQVTSTVVCPGSSSQGCPVTVKNQIDMSAAQSPDSLLGSFTGTLAWDPNLLHYTGNSGLLSGFIGNVTADTITGLISFSGTHPSGLGGIFDILNADFEATGPVGTAPQLNLDFSAMASAGTLTNLLPTLTINNCTLTISESDLWGDIDNDNAANSTDGLIILSYDAGLPLPPNFLERISSGFGDVNSDNATNSTDALIILSYDAGFPVPYPVGQIFCNSISRIMAERPD